MAYLAEVRRNAPNADIQEDDMRVVVEEIGEIARRAGLDEPGILFTKAELKEIEAVGKRWAKQIKEKGDKAKYQADKRGYLMGPQAKVSTGELVEAAGVEEVLAYAKGLTVLRSIHIKLLDSAGKTLGGTQAELDFLVLGTAAEVDIISAKLARRRVSPKVDRRNLNHYLAMPLSPPDIVTYAETHFGKNKAYANIATASVFHHGGSMPLADFRTNVLGKVTVVDTVNVVPLTPADPTATTGIRTLASDVELFDKVIEYIDKNI